MQQFMEFYHEDQNETFLVFPTDHRLIITTWAKSERCAMAVLVRHLPVHCATMIV